MKEYKRKYPLFSLCGLNCGLCPRYHTDGASKCPGCGGPDFHLKHPTCAVITCNKKHDDVEFCFQCSSYPCERYLKQKKADSFISYRNVLVDFKKSKEDIAKYKTELNGKVKILKYLIAHCNDGKKKNFYCVAVNHLKLSDLKNIMDQIDKQIKSKDVGSKNKIEIVVDLIEKMAKKENVELRLRK
jgi:hypothetical protein